MLLVALFIAAPASGSTKVVLILADYLTFSDLTNPATPGIAALARDGGIGLLTPSAVSARNPEASYASASAGSNCWGSGAVDSAFDGSESLKSDLGTAAEVYRRRTGKSDTGGVVLPELFQLRMENKSKGATSLPGALGDALAHAGRRCAVFGNSDPGAGDYRRRGAVIAATSDGLVSIGNVSSDGPFRLDAFSPTGRMIDSDLLVNQVDEALDIAAQFVVVDFGDTDRVELNRYKLSEKAYETQHKRAIANLDAFVSNMLSRRGRDTKLILVSMVSPQGPDGERLGLGPVVIREPGGGTGRLISATTRTPGLVAAADFAPTVLHSLGVDTPKGMIGAPIVTTGGGAVEVKRLSDIVVMNRRLMTPILAMLGGVGILAVTLACLVLVFGRAASLGGIMKLVLVFMTAAPVSVLFAMFGEPSVSGYVLRLVSWMIGLTAASFMLSFAMKKAAPGMAARLPGALPVIVLMIFSCLVLFVDSLTGGDYSRFTVFSAGRFDGYRFYGLGNEFMGVWLGMAMVSIVWLRECFPGWTSRIFGRVAVLAVCLAIIVALGFPRFGANYGGAVAAVIGLGLVYRSGTVKRFRWYEVVGLLAASFAMVLVTGIADMMLSKGSPTHIGRAASLSGGGWYMYLPVMAVRKVAMNLALIATPQAKYAIIGSVPFFVLWFWSVGKKFDRMTEGKPAMRWGIAAAIIGAAAAFIFNDSGIVAWGLIMGFTAAVVAYTLVDLEAAEWTG